jgi:hypothetical protein
MTDKQVSIPSTNIGGGIFKDMNVDRIQFGTTSIGEIKLKDIDATASVGTTRVKDVKMSLDLRFSIKACIRINLVIKKINWCTDRFSLGTLHIPEVPVGDMSVNMSNVKMLIDEVSVDPLNIKINPVRDVHADRLRAKEMRLNDLNVPSNPFSLDGMDIDNMTLKDMEVPAVYADFLEVEDVNELQVTIPKVTLPEINLKAHAGKITSTQDLKTDANISEKSIYNKWGWIRVYLNVKPTAHISIGELAIIGVGISTRVNFTEIKNITVPINIFEITMGEVNIENINVPGLDLLTI